MKKDRLKQLKEFEKKLGFELEDICFLDVAFTHSSYANENKVEGLQINERLEFLGDSVVSLIISEVIFKTYRNKPEGFLTKLRSQIVCEKSLAEVATHLDMGNYLLLGKGEELSGGRERASILADTYEAVCGAIYLDQGIPGVRTFIEGTLGVFVKEDPENPIAFVDYKTKLQEYMHKHSSQRLRYKIVNETGPDHNKIFYVEVSDGKERLGEGSGSNKKQAEQHAAKVALEKLGAIHA